MGRRITIQALFLIGGCFMSEINAKVWREMSTAEVLKSLDVAISVLEKREIDKEWLKLLLDVGLRCIQLVNEQW